MSYRNSIFCDESSHLERDGHAFMGLAALSCATSKVRDHNRELRNVVRAFGYSPYQEIKWTKLSPSNVTLYANLVRYFFNAKDLSFRAIIAGKKNLRHARFAQTHDDWYYKMYFRLLEQVISPKLRYRIYVDIKDTLGGWRVKKLAQVLSNAMRDFDSVAIENIQQIRSHESPLLQLADVLLGATVYAQEPGQSDAKRELIEMLREISGYGLTRSTFLAESKFNIFHWTGQSLD